MQVLVNLCQLLLIGSVSIHVISTLGNRGLVSGESRRAKTVFIAKIVLCTTTGTPASPTTPSTLSSASASSITATLAPTPPSTPILVQVLLREVITEVDTFIVKQLLRFILLFASLRRFSCHLTSSTLSILIREEAKQGTSIDLGVLVLARVLDVQVRLQLVLGLERHVALRLAAVVGANEVRTLEVPLQRLVVVVVHLLVVVTAQVTRQMHAIQMFHERVHIEEELLAEIAPRVRQDFGATVRGGIAFLDVASQVLHVVDPLLANEHGPSLEAD